ncbi:MAG: peptidylprolyl isomerase [Deltaproteobacteria bacterium]
MRMHTRMLAALLVPALFACGGPPGKKPDTVLAEVNGETITSAEFDREAGALPPYMRPILETPSGRKQFLESLITRNLLLQEAMRRGIDRRPEVVRRLGQARRSIVLDALLREVGEKAPGLSEEMLRKRYEEHAEDYRAGERVRVRQILYKEKAQAETAAKKSRKGEPFEKLMKEAETLGGKASEPGFIERGQTDPEFESAAFAASPGTVAGPVRTIYGFHLIEVLEKRPAGPIPFEEVREKIAEEMRESAQREAFEQLVSGLRKASRVTYRGPYSGLTTLEEQASAGEAAAPTGAAEPGATPPAGGR